jgi:transposase
VIFKEIDDEFWETIQPYFPLQNDKNGRSRANLRNSCNGILYVLKTGITWMDVPRMYGNKSTIHRLHLELSETWAYEKIFDEMRSRGYLKGKSHLLLYPCKYGFLLLFSG